MQVSMLAPARWRIGPQPRPLPSMHAYRVRMRARAYRMHFALVNPPDAPMFDINAMRQSVLCCNQTVV